MKEKSYPNFHEHKLEHDNFIIWLETMKIKMGPNPENITELAQSIADFLTAWLTKHILTMDKHYQGKI